MADHGKIVSTTSYVDPSKVGKVLEGAVNHTVTRGIIDAEWKCGACGHPGNPGHRKTCETCGKPKGDDEKYTAPAKPGRYLTPADLAARGVDKQHHSDETCPFCQAKNKPGTQICTQCGGNISDVARTNRVCTYCGRETSEMSCPSCGEATKPKSSLKTAPSHHISIPQPTSKDDSAPSIPPIYILGGIVLLIIACLGIWGIFSYFSPKESPGTVSADSWTCSVPQAQNQYNLKGSFDGVPSGGVYVQEYMKWHHDDTVPDHIDYNVCHNEWEIVGYHYEDKTTTSCTTDCVYTHSEQICYQDGTCENKDYCSDVETCKDTTTKEKINDYDNVPHCEDIQRYKQVPVEKLYTEYMIWEWVSLQPLETSGTDNHIACSEVEKTETMRQDGDPTITCSTSFLVGKKTYDYSPPCTTEFPMYSLGSQWQLTISGPAITKIEVMP